MSATGTVRRKAAGDPNSALRQHLLELLSGGHAHLDFEKAIDGIPAELRNRAPDNVPHTPWRLLEHLRIAQWDIVRFSLDASHVSPPWPDGYWPNEGATDAAWQRSVQQFRDDLEAMKRTVADPASDLFTPFPWGDGQTLLREALLVADHNAYHLGELVVVRRALGAWKG